MSNERIQALISEQASEWLIRLEEGALTPHERTLLTDWLTTSPVHVEEFLNARATWETLTGRAFEQVPDDAALIQMFAAHAAAEVVPLHDPRRIPSGRPLLVLAAGLGGLLLTGGLALWILNRSDANHQTYTTDIGEQTSHVLADGSSVVLNTASKVRLDWSKDFRDLHLESGEALFDVARDPQRPFRVWVGESLIQAVGTRFNIYRTEQGTTVTVLDGKVNVTSRDATSNSTTTSLSIGEQALLAPQSAVQTRQLSTPERVVAWQERRLIFDGQPLEQVAAQFNRYHKVPLVIADRTLAAKRIHGIFNASDRASLITFLEETDEVTTQLGADALVIRRKSSKD